MPQATPRSHTKQRAEALRSRPSHPSRTQPEDSSVDLAAEPPDCEHESLKKAVTHTLEEARMILPGVQALFGFQLIAI